MIGSKVFDDQEGGRKAALAVFGRPVAVGADDVYFGVMAQQGIHHSATEFRLVRVVTLMPNGRKCSDAL